MSKEYDIGAANERQSDFLGGWNDGEEKREPRCQREAYLRGWSAGIKSFVASCRSEDDEPFANYSDAARGE